MNTATGQKTPLPRAASTVHFTLFDGGDELAARPTPLVEVRPQQGVLRHTVECIADVVPMVQILDVPVPQSGDQVVEVLQKIDVPLLPEQVIDVPKISQDLALLRLGDRLRQPQTAEQLMEVPTIVSYSSLLEQTAEQTDDNPVPGRGGGGGARGGLRGFRFRVRQNSAALVEQIADIPARRGLQGSPRRNRAAYSGAHSRAEDRFRRQNPAADVGQVADIPARRGLSDFLPGPGVPQRPHRVCMMALMMEFNGFFRTSSLAQKKSEGTRQSESGGARQCQLIHAGSSGASVGLGHGPLW